jgi:hypothetical protein
MIFNTMCWKENGRKEGSSCDLEVGEMIRKWDIFDIMKYVNYSTLFTAELRYIQENILLHFETVINPFCRRIQVSTQQKICDQTTDSYTRYWQSNVRCLVFGARHCLLLGTRHLEM